MREQRPVAALADVAQRADEVLLHEFRGARIAVRGELVVCVEGVGVHGDAGRGGAADDGVGAAEGGGASGVGAAEMGRWVAWASGAERGSPDGVGASVATGCCGLEKWVSFMGCYWYLRGGSLYLE